MKLIGKAPRLRPGGSPPTRGAWIEILDAGNYLVWSESPPTRGAWIEMPELYACYDTYAVAPHTGGVD